MFIVSLFIIVPKWTHHRCSSVVGQINRQWYILTKIEEKKKKTSLYTQPAMQNLPAVQETHVWSLGQEDVLEKEMATHSSILAWKIL